MKIKGTLVAAALSIAVLSGCSTVAKLDSTSGTSISQEQLNSFTKGKTRREDVVAKVGQPPRKSEVMGKEVWSYPYTLIAAMPFAPNKSETTVFEFDKNGVLLSAYKTGGTPGQTGNALLDAAGQ